MRTFKTQDKHWEISFSIGLFRQLKGEVGLDLMNPNAPVTKGEQETVLMRLHSDLSAFLSVLCAVTRKQRESAEISDEAFDELLTPAVISDAREMFFAEYLDFFSRSGLKTVTAIAEKTIEALNQAEHQIRSIKTTGQPSGSLPPSADSTSAV